MSKISNIVMAAAMTTLVSINYASAATVEIDVKSKNTNSTDQFTLLGYVMHGPYKSYSFPAKEGGISITVDNDVYLLMMLRLPSGGGVGCRESPRGALLNQVDLNGDDKSINLIVDWNKAHPDETNCYAAKN